MTGKLEMLAADDFAPASMPADDGTSPRTDDRTLEMVHRGVPPLGKGNEPV